MSKNITPKTWDEFRVTGLAWFINSILHTFGWAIIYEVEDGKVKSVYPGRCKFRGFTESDQDEGFKKITQYLKESIDDLVEEVNE